MFLFLFLVGWLRLKEEGSFAVVVAWYSVVCGVVWCGVGAKENKMQWTAAAAAAAV